MRHKIEKQWEHEGNLCVVILHLVPGHRCGYVGVPKTHPLYGKDYSDAVPENLIEAYKEVEKGPVGKRGIMDMICHDPANPKIGILFDVHGGITYSAGGEKGYPTKTDKWFFGYDCGHAGDSPDIQDLDYCIAECESLSKQLNNLEG